MFQVHIDADCADTHMEVLPSEVETTEFMIEELVGQLLLEHFDEVVVEEITINFSLRSPQGQHHCTIHLRAHCLGKSSLSSPDELERVTLVVEERMSSALVELFGTVYVGRVTISSHLCNNVIL
jgi:hypothetical protein